MARQSNKGSKAPVPEYGMGAEVAENMEEMRVTKRDAIAEEEEYCPLVNKVVVVRFINTGSFEKNHLLYGGAVDTAKFSFCAPMLKNGNIKNVLNDKEKEYFENLLGVNLSSLVKPSMNYWSTSNPNGIGSVILEKGENRFDLSDPMDYLRVKVLKANSSVVASSISEMNDNPKVTYKFVIVSEDDEARNVSESVTNRRLVYRKIEDYCENKHALAYIIYVLDHDNVEAATPIDFLIDRVYGICDRNPSLMYRLLLDKMFDTKVLIRRMISAEVVYVENDQYYISETNKPMHRNGHEADLDEACIWINLPENSSLVSNLKSQLPR